MYARHSGTSMAAPFVAGAVAACAGAFPAETLDERIARVLGSVERRPELRGRCTTAGTLDLGAALGGTGAGDDTLPPVTQVVGRDDRWHDVPVSLSLWASDGAGGSGVARTEWRIDGGKWTTGCELRVRAKADTKATHTVDYRSFDRAGNREPKKSCEVNIDTTSTADDDVPGVVLPPSPIAGDAGWWVDDYDVYAVDLDAGQSLKAVATALPGTWPELSSPSRGRRVRERRAGAGLERSDRGRQCPRGVRRGVGHLLSERRRDVAAGRL